MVSKSTVFGREILPKKRKKRQMWVFESGSTDDNVGCFD